MVMPQRQFYSHAKYSSTLDFSDLDEGINLGRDRNVLMKNVLNPEFNVYDDNNFKREEIFAEKSLKMVSVGALVTALGCPDADLEDLTRMRRSMSGHVDETSSDTETDGDSDGGDDDKMETVQEVGGGAVEAE